MSVWRLSANLMSNEGFVGHKVRQYWWNISYVTEAILHWHDNQRRRKLLCQRSAKEQASCWQDITRRIEHLHLTLRSRIKRLDRKTICFSRSVEIHEKVIGSFIEKHMFCWLEPSPENIRQLNNNDFFFMGSHTLSHIPLKISHQLTNTSSEICIKLIA